jgi:serine/threonine protein kinase
VSSFRDLLTHAVKGTYEIERELGSGASAVVYLARSVKHDRHVAIKVLRPEMAAMVGGARFLREIEIAAKLTHPHILPLLDSDEVDGLLYLVTPYIEGESLRERIDRDGTLGEEDAIRLTGEVAGALHYAHSRGVVHRDIKPENILLQDGRAIVADFGISLTVGEVEKKRLTESGLVLGTPWYMSPEQVAGSEHVDSRSDIYSLACTLYELLVGEPPFAGDNPQIVLVRQLSAEAPSLRSHLPSASAELESCLSKALSKNPDERFSTAREFSQALELPLALSRARSGIGRPPFHARRWLATAIMVAIAVATFFLFPHPRSLERDWLVVADFEGPSTDPALAVAFRELVTSELNRSHFVETLPRQQLNVVLRNAGLAETSTVNSDLARELAIRSAVRAVVSGSIRSISPTKYRLDLRVTNAERGGEILSVEDDASSENLMPAIAGLAEKLRQRLGEKRSTIAADRPLLDIATPSLPAYRDYVTAIALKQRGDVVESNRALGQALARDTGFASAWALLGMNYVDQRNFDSARTAFAEALRRPSRMSDANKFRLRGDAAYAIDYNLEEAVRWYKLFLRETPQSIGGRNNLGLYLSLLGRREEALAEFTRSASENPLGAANAQAALLNETLVLNSLGRRDRARAVSRNLTGPFLVYAELQIANASGDLDSAERLAAAPANDSTTLGLLRVDAATTMASVLAGRGRIAEADQRLLRTSSSAAGAQRRWYSNVRSLLAFVSRQPLRNAGLPLSRDTSTGELLSSAFAAYATGDTSLPTRNLALLRTGTKADSARLGQGIPVLQGLLDARNRRWASIVEHLSRMAIVGEPDATNLDRIPAVWSRCLVADAYDGLQRPDSAIFYRLLAIADTGIASGHLSVRALVVPFARRELAREYDLIGEHDRARAEWSALLASFAHPDSRGARLVREADAALSPSQ